MVAGTIVMGTAVMIVTGGTAVTIAMAVIAVVAAGAVRTVPRVAGNARTTVTGAGMTGEDIGGAKIGLATEAGVNYQPMACHYDRYYGVRCMQWCMLYNSGLLLNIMRITLSYRM